MTTKNRVTVQLGEKEKDLLTLDAYVSGRTPSLCAGQLLAQKIQEEEVRINEDLEYLANKKGLILEDLKKLVLSGGDI